LGSTFAAHWLLPYQGSATWWLVFLHTLAAAPAVQRYLFGFPPAGLEINSLLSHCL
jgi:hypothetical protein